MANLLIERAEEYPEELLPNIQKEEGLTALEFSLDDYLKNPLGRPYFLAGDKGSGKTFSARRVASWRVRRDPNFVPAFVVYKQHGRLEPLDPTLIAKQGVWGERWQTVSEKDPQTLLENCNAAFIDDCHYVCEDIAAGNRELKKDFIELLRKLVSKAGRGAPTVLISESLLSTYSPVIGSDEFDFLLPQLGMRNPHNGQNSEKDVLALHQIPRHSPGPTLKMLDVKADDYVKKFFQLANANPRGIVRFLKHFSSELEQGELKYEDVVRSAEKVGMPRMGRFEQLYRVLFSVPFVEEGVVGEREVSRFRRTYNVPVYGVRWREIFLEKARQLNPPIGEQEALGVAKSIERNYTSQQRRFGHRYYRVLTDSDGYAEHPYKLFLYYPVLVALQNLIYGDLVSSKLPRPIPKVCL